MRPKQTLLTLSLSACRHCPNLWLSQQSSWAVLGYQGDLGEPRWCRLSSVRRLLCHEPPQHWHFPALHGKFYSRPGELGRFKPKLDKDPSLFSTHQPQHLETQPKLELGHGWSTRNVLALGLCCRKPLPSPFPSASPGHHETFRTKKCHSSDLSQSPMDLTLDLTSPCLSFTIMDSPGYPP